MQNDDLCDEKNIRNSALANPACGSDFKFLHDPRFSGTALETPDVTVPYCSMLFLAGLFYTCQRGRLCGTCYICCTQLKVPE